MGKSTGAGFGGDYSKHLREKDLQMNSLQARFDQIEGSYKGKEQMFERTKSLLDEALNELQAKKTEILNLQTQLQAATFAANHSKGYEKELFDARAEINSLNLRIMDLAESPFIKNAGSQTATYKRLQEAERELSNFKTDNQDLRKQVIEFKMQIEELSRKLETAQKERDIYKDDNIKFKIRYEGSGLNPEDIQKLLAENDPSRFRETMMKIGLDAHEPIWARLDFLEKNPNVDKNDPTSLLKEIERLMLEKAQLASELEKAETQLKIRMDIEKENTNLMENQIEEYKMRMKAATTKADEYAKITEYKATRINQLEKNLHLQASAQYDVPTVEKLKSMSAAQFARTSLAPDAMSEFSVDTTETELRPGENVIDLWIDRTQFYPDSLMQVFDHGMFDRNNPQLVTFLTFDFYNHDTQHSQIVEGIEPNYGLQVGFRVNVDEFFISYLQKEALYLDVYVSKGTTAFIIGKSKVFLYELIERGGVTLEKNLKTPVIDGVAQITSLRFPDIGIGVIKYKLRMRHPISEAIRWFKEKHDLLRSDNLMRESKAKFDQISKRRIINILIKNCEGISSQASKKKALSVFVYYQFYTCQDHYSKSSSGNNPIFEDSHSYEIIFNNAFLSYIESTQLEMLIFDESTSLEEEPSLYQTRQNLASCNYLLGRAKVSLRDLIKGADIEGTYRIHDSAGKENGVVNLKLSSYEPQEERKQLGTLVSTAKIWEIEILRKFVDQIKKRKLDLDSAFSLTDDDYDGVISRQDFKIAITDKFRIQNVNHNEIEMFIKDAEFFKNKLDIAEFKKRIGLFFV